MHPLQLIARKNSFKRSSSGCLPSFGCVHHVRARGNRFKSGPLRGAPELEPPFAMGLALSGRRWTCLCSDYLVRLRRNDRVRLLLLLLLPLPSTTSHLHHCSSTTPLLFLCNTRSRVNMSHAPDPKEALSLLHDMIFVGYASSLLQCLALVSSLTMEWQDGRTARMLGR